MGDGDGAVRKRRVFVRFWNPLRPRPDGDYHCRRWRLRDLEIFNAWHVTVNGRGFNGHNYDEWSRFYFAVAFGFGLLVIDIPKKVA